MSNSMDQFQSFITIAKSLYPNKDFIGLHEPVFKGNEKKYTERCIDSTFVSSVGEFVGGQLVELEVVGDCSFLEEGFGVGVVEGEADETLSVGGVEFFCGIKEQQVLFPGDY